MPPSPLNGPLVFAEFQNDIEKIEKIKHDCTTDVGKIGNKQFVLCLHCL